jgi:sterol 3beta-glucosyltransferase
VMLASGTRGDVQPYLAVALGLRRAGLRSVIAAAPRYRSLVESRQVEFAPLEGNPSDLMADSDSMAATLKGGALKGIASTARFLRAAQSEYRRMLESGAAACRGARAILAGLSSTWGTSIAEALGIPCVLCMLQPFGRTRAFPSALLPLRASLGGRCNLLSYRVVEQAMWLPWRRVTNDWRLRTLGLPTLPVAGSWRTMYASGFPCLYGFSPAVVPAPADWPVSHVVTGYWFLEEEPGWKPGPSLEQFLSAGSPTLYVGFGSMGTSQERNMVRVVEAALELSGLRAVVSPGSRSPGLLPDPSPRVIFEEEVPHGWLFPRMAAVMHHGGAGTTGEVLRAGIPSLIFPGASDQYFWAERISRLGAGPHPIGRADLTPAGLAKLFTRAVTDREMRDRARLIGEKIRAEDGVTRAVEELLQLIGQAGLRRPVPAWPAEK